MKYYQKLLFFVVVSTLISGCASYPSSSKLSGDKTGEEEQTSEVGGVLIHDIKTELAGKKKIVRIEANAPFQYMTYMLEKPRRLAVEIRGAKSLLPTASIMVDDYIIKHITALNFAEANAVRVEIWLTRPMMFDLTLEKSTLSILLTPYEEKNDPAAMAERLILTHEYISRLKDKVTRLQDQLSELQYQYNIDENTIADLIEELNSIGALPIKAEAVEEEAAPEKDAMSEPPEIADVTEEEIAPDISVIEEQISEAASSEESGKSDKAEISELIGKWKSAWQSRDWEAYSGFYAGTFLGKGMGVEEWLAVKKEKFSKTKKVSVEINNLNIEVDGAKGSAEFTQLYSSDQYNDEGVKTIMFVKTDEGWKIESENWRP